MHAWDVSSRVYGIFNASYDAHRLYTSLHTHTSRNANLVRGGHADSCNGQTIVLFCLSWLMQWPCWFMQWTDNSCNAYSCNGQTIHTDNSCRQFIQTIHTDNLCRQFIMQFIFILTIHAMHGNRAHTYIYNWCDIDKNDYYYYYYFCYYYYIWLNILRKLSAWLHVPPRFPQGDTCCFIYIYIYIYIQMYTCVCIHSMYRTTYDTIITYIHI